MKFLIITDTHGIFKAIYDQNKENIPEVDQVILLGDHSTVDVKQIKDIYPNCVGIYGNHDVYETLNGVICFDHKLLGSKFTYTGFNGSHRYKPTQIFGYNQMESIQQAISLPKADVLFSHDGPFNQEQDDAHCGLKGIDRYIQDNKPKTVIHGHLHKPNHYTYKYFLSSAEVYCVYQLAVVDFNDDGTVRELIQLETI